MTFISVALLSWVLMGAPLHTINKIEPASNAIITVKPLEVNEEAPHYRPESYEGAPEIRSEEELSYSPEPYERALERDVDEEHEYVSMAKAYLEELIYDPCNDTLRKEFAKSLKPFYKAATSFLLFKDLSDEQIEYFEPLGEMVMSTANDGLILKKDVPFHYRILLSEEIDWPKASACLRLRMEN